MSDTGREDRHAHVRRDYDRDRLVWTLVYHQPTNTSGCICGWGVLGASHAEHVADMYEAAAGAGRPPAP